MRRVVFKLVDFMKGSPIQNELEDLSSFGYANYDSKEFLSFQEARLRKIITYSKHNVAFYKNLSVTLSELPVLNKLHLRNNLSDHISDEFEVKRLKEVRTSGSTGLPFKVYQSKLKVNRNSADTIKFGELGGFNFGTPLAYLKIWNNINYKSPWVQTIQNIIPVDVLNLSDQRITNLINEFNFRANLSFLGYASALEIIAASVRRCGLDVKIKVSSIITMSEGIDLNGRKRIQSVFNCPVYARYSNVENGIIAQQISMQSDRYLINSSSYFVEILDWDVDFAVPNGRIGRIVITDYFNTGMPMIRYDTGDIGAKVVINDKEGVKEYLVDVGGRKMDVIYNTAGELISSFIITNGMWNYSELIQYQFIQLSKKKYKFKLIVDKVFNRETDLINEFKTYLGDDAVIDVEYANEIPVLASGKRRKVVNLMQNIE